MNLAEQMKSIVIEHEKHFNDTYNPNIEIVYNKTLDVIKRTAQVGQTCTKIDLDSIFYNTNSLKEAKIFKSKLIERLESDGFTIIDDFAISWDI